MFQHKKINIISQYNCEHCPLRAKYDKNPKSLVGRFWRWHINFCPGWKSYMRSVDDGTKAALKTKYRLK